MITIPDGPRRTRFVALLRASALLAAIAAGCGRAEPAGPSMTGDAAAISDLIDELNERGPDPGLFVEGRSPEAGSLAVYGRHSFALTGPPRVSGSPATVPILIYDEAAGREAGQLDWTFARVDDAWKLESAPLP